MRKSDTRPGTKAGGPFGLLPRYGQPLYAWSYHHLAARVETTTYLLWGLGLVLLLVLWTTRSVMWLVGAALFFFVTLGGYFLPYTYTLTDRGVVVQSLIHRDFIPWTRVKSFTVYPDGLQLSFSPANLRGALIRGAFLFWGETQNEAVEIVRQHVPVEIPASELSRRRK